MERPRATAGNTPVSINAETVTSESNGGGLNSFSPDLAQSPRSRINKIIRKACSRGRVTQKELFGKERHARLVRVRHAAIVAVVKELPWLSTPELGRIFKRDHSTIVYVLQKHAAGTIRSRKTPAIAGGAASNQPTIPENPTTEGAP